MFSKRKFKSELANIVKLFILLILFFWSCTWNSDPNLDFYQSEPRKVEASKFPKDTSSSKIDASVLNQHSVLIETFSTVQHTSRKSAKTVSAVNGILPSFNEWKETERIKNEKLSSKNGTVSQHKKASQRKLNYASAKCGAKILASNPEARHRIAILNEKPDEYMLNPCKVKMWFVIELCDTVEATQLDLANYELFSSSPREFSVFWSEVYPTSAWHLLGTFQAKDQRTMQTFRLNSKNLGKFIKVILYSHHGKEHFCLLSVIRVLGYSMVEKLEDIEENEESSSISALDNQSAKQIDKKSTAEKEQSSNGTIKKEFFTHINRIPSKICALYFKHCCEESTEDLVKSCTNKVLCRFFTEVLSKDVTICDNFSLSGVNKMPLKTSDTRQAEKESETEKLANIFPLNMKMKHDNTKKVTTSTPDDIFKDYKFVDTLNQNINASVSNGINKRDENLTNTWKWDQKISENFSNTKSFNKQENDEMVYEEFKINTDNIIKENCNCKEKTVGEISKENRDKNIVKESEQDLSILETDVDSAGLIQKESVLFKLTTRIKASEIDLDLINKYLQQLSQSYRQQMEDMQVMFNQTIKAIDAATGKAELIDEKQQESINTLQKKITSLTRKVDYMMNGQRDLLNRVFEMHAFFLILEIIIISTIFTIFMNILHQKNALMKQQFLDKKGMMNE